MSPTLRRRANQAGSSDSNPPQAGSSTPVRGASPPGPSRSDAPQVEPAEPARPIGQGGPSHSKPSQVRVKEQGITILADPAGKPIADVVFVHGLQGHPEKTWTFSGHGRTRESAAEPSSENATQGCFNFNRRPSAGRVPVFWPTDLLREDQKKVRLMTYGYDSTVTKCCGLANHMSLSDHGRQFLGLLSYERLKAPKRPLIFVAHSLGGLIVKEALVRSRDEKRERREHVKGVYKSTVATMFFGTPHRGSPDAGWGDMFRRLAALLLFDTAKTLLDELDTSSGNTKLEDLREAFSRMLREQSFHVYTFQEFQGKVSVAMGNQPVVPKESSALNEPESETIIPMNSNHMAMCKFTGREDDGYIKFRNALDEVMRQIQPRQRQGGAGALTFIALLLGTLARLKP